MLLRRHIGDVVQMTTPTWTEGEPDNLEAAAEDAYKWLAYTQARSKKIGMTTEDWGRLDSCMEALRGFLTPND